MFVHWFLITLRHSTFIKPSNSTVDVKFSLHAKEHMFGTLVL